MLRASESVMLRAGLEVKLSKCTVFHVRRSGNNWYKGRKNDLPEVIVQSNTLRLLNMMIIINVLESHCPSAEKMKNKLRNS